MKTDFLPQNLLFVHLKEKLSRKFSKNLGVIEDNNENVIFQKIRNDQTNHQVYTHKFKVFSRKSQTSGVS